MSETYRSVPVVDFDTYKGPVILKYEFGPSARSMKMTIEKEAPDGSREVRGGPTDEYLIFVGKIAANKDFAFRQFRLRIKEVAIPR